MPKVASTFRLPVKTSRQLEVLNVWTTRSKTDLVAEAIGLLYAVKLNEKSDSNTPAIHSKSAPSALKTDEKNVQKKEEFFI